jgi:hypothetical protein
MAIGAVATQTWKDGRTISLLPLIGAPNKLVWQDQNNNECAPPPSLQAAWATIHDWIETNPPA